MPVTSIFTDDPTVANRYLADQLTEAERKAFEQRLIDDPAALRELEATARLKLALQKLRGTGRIEGLVAARQPRTPWLLSAAAAAAMLVLGIGVLRWSNDPAPMMAASLASLVDDGGNPLSIASTYAVFHKRADAYDAVIQLPASRQAIELRVLPDLGRQQPPPYRASLSQIGTAGNTDPIVSIESLQPGDDGFVSIFIDSARMSPGEYVLDLSSPVAGDRASATFMIRFTPNQ
jgi:hypothetical protein